MVCDAFYCLVFIKSTSRTYVLIMMGRIMHVMGWGLIVGGGPFSRVIGVEWCGRVRRGEGLAFGCLAIIIGLYIFVD